MKISIEELIEIIVSEVIKELGKQGVEIDFGSQKRDTGSSKEQVKEIDMSEYKTPILTENQLLALGEDIKEIIIPGKTIITPVAHEIAKKRKLIINKV